MEAKKHRLDGVVGWDCTAAQLSKFLTEAAGDDVEITISSPGGLVGEALDMYNQIKNYPGKTTAILSGYAMSAMSYVPMAFDHVIAEDNAIMMIHNAQGVALGDHHTMVRTAEILRGMSSLIGGAYARFTGKTRSEIAALLDAETWFFGSEIVNNGFAHDVIPAAGDEATEDMRSLANVLFSNMQSRLRSDSAMVSQDLNRVQMALGSTITQTRKDVPMKKTANHDARQAWNQDQQLQADFNGDYEKYVSFLKEDKGINFKIMGGNVTNISVRPGEEV